MSRAPTINLKYHWHHDHDSDGPGPGQVSESLQWVFVPALLLVVVLIVVPLALQVACRECVCVTLQYYRESLTSLAAAALHGPTTLLVVVAT